MNKYINRISREIPEIIKDPVVSSIIIADEITNIIGEKIRDIKIARYIEDTVIIKKENIVLNRFTRLFDGDGVGRLRELVIVSDKDNYIIRIYSDDVVKIDNSFKKLMESSPYLNTIDAFKSDNKYILRISDIKWMGKLKIDLIPLEKIFFEKIIVLADIKKEVK